MFNALDPDNAPLQSGPLAPKKKPLDSSRPKPSANPGFNAKPDANVNTGAAPGMMGDKQKIAKPAVPRIAPSTATAAQAGAPISGIDGAMGALADKLHPRKQR